MAKTLQLTDGTITCDFLSGNFVLADEGWETQVANEPVWETFTLLAHTTDANIRAEQLKLDKLKELANRYMGDKKEANPVLLKVASEGESVKQSVVLDIQALYSGESNVSPLLGANSDASTTVVSVTLGVLRMPYYEPDAAGHVTATAANLNTGGAKWVIGNAGGTLDQRIAKLVISDNSGFSEPIRKVWVGIRRVRGGTTNFTPRAEAESGARFNDTTIVADASCSGGNKVRTSFATVTPLAERLRINVTHFSAQALEMVGDYLVLGRITLDADTTEVHLQLKQGYMGYGNLASIAGDTYLSGVQDPGLASNWHLIELGYVSIPAVGIRDGVGTAAAVSRYTLSLWAERMSAGGNFDIDFITLIPTDAFAYLSEAIIGIDPDQGGVTGDARIFTSPLDERFAIGSVLTDAWFASINSSFGNWFYPYDGGVMVVAGEIGEGSNLNYTMDLSIELVPRWPVFRG